LGALYANLEEVVAEAVARERRLRVRTRQEVLRQLATRPGAPKGAGVYQASVEDLRRIHANALFTGQVEACDGVARVHDTLPLTVAQIGVCLVSYQGDLGAWAQRLYRRDLQLSSTDPVDDAVAALHIRRAAGPREGTGERRTLADLGRRGILSYIERSVLTDEATAPWRLGHGQPAPLELLTGSGSMELMQRSVALLRQLIQQHRRFVFVPPSTEDRALLTIGDALEPLEFAIVDTMRDRWQQIIDRAWFDPPDQHAIQSFVDEVGQEVVVGVFRASEIAPAQLFFAHIDLAEQAGAIAMADAALQAHRGFPLLLEIAGAMCRGSFGMDTLVSPVAVAYAEAGEPWRHG
ncbi:MAG: hypothetical protein ACYDCQ_23165, partial [Dehalococcoidia bacterium]